MICYFTDTVNLTQTIEHFGKELKYPMQLFLATISEPNIQTWPSLSSRNGAVVVELLTINKKVKVAQIQEEASQ